MDYRTLMLSYERNTRFRNEIEAESLSPNRQSSYFFQNQNVLFEQECVPHCNEALYHVDVQGIQSLCGRNFNVERKGTIVHPKLGWLCHNPVAFVYNVAKANCHVVVACNVSNRKLNLEIANYAAFVCSEHVEGTVLFEFEKGGTCANVMFVKCDTDRLVNWLPSSLLHFQSFTIPQQLNRIDRMKYNWIMERFKKNIEIVKNIIPKMTNNSEVCDELNRIASQTIGDGWIKSIATGDATGRPLEDMINYETYTSNPNIPNIHDLYSTEQIEFLRQKIGMAYMLLNQDSESSFNLTRGHTIIHDTLGYFVTHPSFIVTKTDKDDMTTKKGIVNVIFTSFPTMMDAVENVFQVIDGDGYIKAEHMSIMAYQSFVYGVKNLSFFDICIYNNTDTDLKLIRNVRIVRPFFLYIIPSIVKFVFQKLIEKQMMTVSM